MQPATLSVHRLWRISDLQPGWVHNKNIFSDGSEAKGEKTDNDFFLDGFPKLGYLQQPGVELGFEKQKYVYEWDILYGDQSYLPEET